jgi:hypothetical protein
LQILLFAFFVSLSAGWEIPAQGPLIYLAGFFALLLILFLWIAEPPARLSPPSLSNRPVIFAFRGFAAWAGLLWVLAPNWGMRTGTVLGWFLSALVLSSLLGRRNLDWRQASLLFALGALPVTGAGLYQHFAAIGLYRKDLVGWFAGATSVPVVGFFGHPNDFANYLYWPLLAAGGTAFEVRGWRRAALLGLALLLALVILWTYSRATLLAVLFAAVVWLGSRFLRRKRDFILGLAALVVLASAALLWAIHRYSARQVLSGRLQLWTRAVQDILHGPYYLIAGYLAVPSPRLRVFYYPHNIYLLIWTLYGVVGLAALMALGIFLLRLGWRLYRELRDQPTFAALWAGMAGFFLVNGMVSFYFQETYDQLMFVTVLVLMLGLNRRGPERGAGPVSPCGPGDGPDGEASFFGSVKALPRRLSGASEEQGAEHSKVPAQGASVFFRMQASPAGWIGCGLGGRTDLEPRGLLADRFSPRDRRHKIGRSGEPPRR